MAGHSWHAFFYDGRDASSPPVRSAMIQADKEEDAIRIARESLQRGQRAELMRPRWEGGSAPIMVDAVASGGGAPAR